LSDWVDWMRLGVTSYTFRWAVGGDSRFGDSFRPKRAVDAFGLVDRVSKLGLEVLQIADNMNIKLTAPNYRKLRETAEARGIALQLGTCGIDKAVVKRYAEIAELLGVSLLNVYAAERQPIGEVVERIRGFLPELRDQQLALTLENEDSGIYACHELAEILRRVDDPLVGACVDTMNSTVILEHPFDTVRVLAPYAMCFHLKDFIIRRTSVSGFSIEGVPVGTGMLNVKAVLDMARGTGREPDILLEQFMGRRVDEETTLEEEARWVRTGARFVRSLLSDV